MSPPPARTWPRDGPRCRMRGAHCAWRRAWPHTWRMLALPYQAEHGPQICGRLSCRLGHSHSEFMYTFLSTPITPRIFQRQEDTAAMCQKWLARSLTGDMDREEDIGGRITFGHKSSIANHGGTGVLSLRCNCSVGRQRQTCGDERLDCPGSRHGNRIPCGFFQD
jgi:hypothetical protein